MAQANSASRSARSTLPPRPNLAYLKKLAKERLRSLRVGAASTASPLKLAGAQLAVARDFGFASWRQLKAHVEAMAALAPAPSDEDLSAKVTEFLSAAVSHNTEERPTSLKNAEAILSAEPRIAKASLITACVLGDAKTASDFLKRDPESARPVAGPNAWPPILYLCFSRYLHFRPKREADFVRIAKLLLKHGADPNSLFVHEGFNETALYGAAGISGRPRLTRLLLDAGADPGDLSDKSGNESLYHACEHDDNACLALLLRAKPRPEAVSYCLNRKLDFDDLAGAKLMLDHGADPNHRGPQGGTAVLHAIRRGRSLAFVKLLHRRGATLDATDSARMTPLKLARRLGQSQTIQYLLRQGVADTSDATEQFLAACAAGDASAAKKMLQADGDLLSRLLPDDLRVLPDAAAANHLKPVRVMLDLGFDMNAKGDWDGSAIHHAAWHGHVAMLKLLIRRGADLRQKNGFGGDVLHTALHSAGSSKRTNAHDIVAILRRAMNIDDAAPYLKAAEATGDEKVVAALRGDAQQATTRKTVARTKGDKS